MSEQYISPVQQSIQQAEAAIDNLVAAEGAQWDVAQHDWVVGHNTAATDTDAHVIVTQALGPRPEDGQIQYSALVNGSRIAWKQGASSVGELRREYGASSTSYHDVQLALNALRTISNAKITPPDKPS
jgi:hypothetical protein